MDQLILEHLPFPKHTPTDKKAIERKHDWQYDHSADHVPHSIRNRVPSKLLKDGKLHYPKENKAICDYWLG